MDESKEIEEIDLCKLNISLESTDSVCSQNCGSDCLENIKSNSHHSQYETVNRDLIEENSYSEINNIEKLDISLDSIDLDPSLLENINIPIAKSVALISTGKLKSENMFE